MFNILVVDDQAHIRRLYEYTLEKNGYQPYTAGDGAQALKLMETTHIDLVILDLMMPTMDGYTFLKTMRDSGSSIPVLIITARDSAEDVRTGDRKTGVPKGASGQLGEAELEAIQKVLQEG
mgnify:FL=1